MSNIKVQKVIIIDDKYYTDVDKAASRVASMITWRLFFGYGQVSYPIYNRYNRINVKVLRRVTPILERAMM